MNRQIFRAFSQNLGLFCVVLGVLSARVVDAQVVVDQQYAVSQPWIPFVLTQATDLVVRLNGANTSCQDPLQLLRDRGSAPLCQTPALDVIVHLVRVGGNGVDEPTAPRRCRSERDCNDLVFPISAGSWALLIHAGPEARGILRSNLAVTSLFRGRATPIYRDSIRFSGEVLLDVNRYSPTAAFHSVLVNDYGNLINDDLGVAATEMWVLGEDFRLVQADLAQDGVGPAALLRRVPSLPRAQGTTVRWVLVRPW
jgi:hypothetical protein